MNRAKRRKRSSNHCYVPKLLASKWLLGDFLLFLQAKHKCGPVTLGNSTRRQPNPIYWIQTQDMVRSLIGLYTYGQWRFSAQALEALASYLQFLRGLKISSTYIAVLKARLSYKLG
ncbi:hypothetical protein AVEN_231780-1 [Araneus ventricosus]|uniref:Uncharacterized protein n=1 Tax=Araneus ventricosus TaxID=182803 RepID=A0A4Y2BVR3_ARAVE|nr:hypothetical protein AVEN_231780-1 [Araneus ventricosus]